MTRRAYFYFLLTFLLGLVLGAVGLFSYAWYWGHWHRSFDKTRIGQRLKRDLNLSDAQVQQLGPIVDDWVKEERDLRSRLDPQFQALREEFHDRVRKILSAEQVEKFNELVRRHDERMKRQKPL